jgi:cytochrome c556
MREPRNTRRGIDIVVAAAACSVLVATIAVRAQQPPGPPPGKPLVPLATSSLLLHPELYVGETVALVGTVDRTLSRTAFAVVEDKSKPSPKNLLILAPSLITSPEPNTPVTVIGETVRFDPADIARRFKDYTLDLPADLIETYRGQPAIVATSVLNPTMTDLAKRPVPPPTPAEDAFDKTMKQVSPAFAVLRQSVDASATGPVQQRTAELKKLFGDTQAFFKTRGTVDATAWAGDALKLVDSIDAAAAASKWDDAKTAAASLNQVCQTCHAAHRERQDDGTYRVKGLP